MNQRHCFCALTAVSEQGLKHLSPEERYARAAQKQTGTRKPQPRPAQCRCYSGSASSCLFFSLNLTQEIRFAGQAHVRHLGAGGLLIQEYTETTLALTTELTETSGNATARRLQRLTKRAPGLQKRNFYHSPVAQTKAGTAVSSDTV